jgi:hypothetical protein
MWLEYVNFLFTSFMTMQFATAQKYIDLHFATSFAKCTSGVQRPDFHTPATAVNSDAMGQKAQRQSA